MTVRVIVTLHLPLDMGAAGRIMDVVAREYSDAVVAQPDGTGAARIQADDDPLLTKSDRRRIARERMRS